MGKLVKSSTHLIGGPGNPQSIAPGLSASGTFNMVSNLQGGLGVNLKWVGSITVAPSVQIFWSPDGTFFFEDKSVSPIANLPIGASPVNGVDIGPYIAPEFSKALKLTVSNKDPSISLAVIALSASIDYSVDS